MPLQVEPEFRALCHDPAHSPSRTCVASETQSMGTSQKVLCYLKQVEAWNPAVNAMIAIREEVPESAMVPPHSNRMLGLIAAVKDNIAVEGVATTRATGHAEPVWEKSSATAVAALQSQGASIIGKAHLHEMAYGVTSDSPAYGPCLNPFDTTCTSGGSSGGSAVAVATGMADIAFGSDTGGSVRIPAALCGVSGLRPTLGAISTRGLYPLSKSFDTIGPMARSCALLTFVLNTVSSERAQAEWQSRSSDLDRLVIGIPETFFYEGLSKEVATAIDDAIALWGRLGFRLVEVDLPYDPLDAVFHTSRVIRYEAYHANRELLTKTPMRLSKDVFLRFDAGATISHAEYEESLTFIRLVGAQLEGLWDRVGFVLTPTTKISAPKRNVAETDESRRDLTFSTLAWTGANVPSLSIPCGAGGNGLPIGMQMTTGRWQDVQLLRAGSQFQEVTAFHLQSPRLSTTPATDGD